MERVSGKQYERGRLITAVPTDISCGTLIVQQDSKDEHGTLSVHRPRLILAGGGP